MDGMSFGELGKKRMRVLNWLVLLCALGSPVLCVAQEPPAAAPGATKAATAGKAAPVRVLITRDSATYFMTTIAAEAGIYKKHNIDLQVDEGGFAAILSSLPTKQYQVAATYSALPALNQMAKGRDLVFIHSSVGLRSPVIVKKDAPYKSLPDLKGKRLGFFSVGSSTFDIYQVLALDMYGMNLKNDTKLIEAPAPVLQALLDKGDIDAMVTLSGISAQALGSGTARVLFDAHDAWMQRTGQPIAWTSMSVAWRDWVDENPERARNFVAAMAEAKKWAIQNADRLVDRHPQQLGIQSPEAARIMKGWLKDGSMLLTQWGAKTIDAQWRFLELARKHGVISDIPPKEKYTLNLLNE